MKIGILTHPLDYNYGCLLQAFALQKILKSMGHDVVTINRYSDIQKPFFSQMKNWVLRFVYRIIKDKQMTLCWNPYLTMEMISILSSNTKKFADRNITQTVPVFPGNLERVDQEYKFDAYVVGSDQVWLPNFSLNCFLDFVHRDNVKRIFYAASSGSSSFADNTKLASKCKELSTKFCAISVREDSLIPIVNNFLERDAIHVLDPTLLLDSKDYLSACVEKIEDRPIVFTYILDKTKQKQFLIERVALELSLPVVAGSVEKDYERGKGIDIKKCIYPSVDKWLLNMARAKFVVTDSFHGTCLAITFRKPFVVVGNKARGINRFLSLLRLFNLQNRLITSVDEFKDSFYEELDDAKITDCIASMREVSLNFLRENL